MRDWARRAFDFYWGQGIADDVPALTYYLLLSLAPFALGVAALQALLLENVLSAYEAADQLNRFLPEEVHGDIRSLVVGARDNSPLLLTVAVAAMLWTSSGAIGVIERCESRILGCPRYDVVTGRVRNLGLGALVAAAFVAGAAGAPVIGDVLNNLHFLDVVPGGVALVATIVGSIVVFAVIYRYAPKSRLRWRSAFIGAVPAGISVQAVPAIIGAYFGAAAGFAAVRLFLLLAVLLLGLYVMALVLLVGAGFAVRDERKHRGHRRGRLARFRQERSAAEPERDPVLRDDRTGEAGADTRPAKTASASTPDG